MDKTIPSLDCLDEAKLNRIKISSEIGLTKGIIFFYQRESTKKYKKRKLNI